MTRDSRLPQDIEVRLQQAAAFLSADPHVKFVYLFGGLARERRNPLSDVDIAIYLAEASDRTQAKLDLLGGLMKILGTDEVDLVILNDAPLSLRGRIVSGRKVLVDRDPFLRHGFESLTLREFFDFSYKEKQILERRYLRGR